MPGEGSCREATRGDLGIGLDVYRDGDGGTGIGLLRGEAEDNAGETDGNVDDDGDGEDGEAVRYDAVATDNGIAWGCEKAAYAGVGVCRWC